MERYQSTQAIVIKSQSIRESDLRVTLLTPSFGKIVVSAKGAQNIKSSRLGALQLGNIVKVSLYQKNDFIWLSEAKTVYPFLQHQKHLTQINLLFYFLEILNHFVAENQQIIGVYEISEKILKAIADNQLAHFINYEIQLTEILGFGVPPEVHQTFKDKDYVSCQKFLRHHLESILDHPLHSSKLFS